VEKKELLYKAEERMATLALSFGPVAMRFLAFCLEAAPLKTLRAEGEEAKQDGTYKKE
jgi:hypothetical protein